MLNKAFKKIFAVLFFLYPLLVFLAVKYFDPVMASLALSLLLVARIVLASSQSQNSFGKSFDVVLWIVLANNLLNLYFRNEVLLKLYPFIMSFSVFIVFAHSLWIKKPVIEKFARVFEKNLDQSKLNYISRLTKIWTAWLLINSGIALATALFADINVWLFYNNLVFYIVSASLVLGDIAYRRLFIQSRSQFLLSLKNLNPEFCRDADNQVTESKEFLRHVQAVAKDLHNKNQRMLLSIEDGYLFAVAFFAGLVSHREIVIIPNNKLEVREKFRSEYDFIFSDADVLRVEKPEDYEPLKISYDSKIHFFTSGSSGLPKKATKTFKNLLNEIHCLEKTFGPDLKKCTVVGTVTHQHIYGLLFRILWPILSQRTFCSKIAEYPEQLMAFAKKFESVAVISTPAFLKRYYLPDQILDSCKAVFSSGGLLSFQASEIVRKGFLVDPIEVYGSTESGGVAYRQRTLKDQEWVPFDNVQVSVTDDGQLKVTSDYFSEGSLLMGDRVSLSHSGFTLLERVDDVVKIEEKRVSLSEINQRVLDTNLVKDSAVISFEENERQQTACLAVLNESGLELLKVHNVAYVCEQIRKNLQNHFESIVVPRKFRFVESLPYNSQSKLIRSELLGYFDED